MIMDICDKELVVNLTDPQLVKFFKTDKATLAELKTINPYFNISKRRVFHKELDMIAEHCALLFSKAPHLVQPYLFIKSVIDNKELDYDLDGKMQLVELIDENVLYDETLIQFINDYVDSSYDICIEGTIKNNQLQFKDSHAKTIIKVSLAFRFVIPLLCHVMHVNNCKRDDRLFLEMFSKITEYFHIMEINEETGEEVLVDINIKIQKFVETSVQNTLYSDKVIWNYLINKSQNEKTIAIDIHRSLITSMLPKLKMNRSIVSFFHVIIKKQLEYIFTANFKIDYKPIASIRTDSEAINPFARIEQKLVRSGSEVLNVMNKMDIAKFITQHSDMIEKERLDYYMRNENEFVIHTAQTKLLTFFIRKYIGPINVFSLSRVEYMQLVLIAREWFARSKMPFISFIMLARPVPETTHRKSKFTKGKASLEVISSKLYQKLSGMYDHLGFESENDPILHFLGEIITQDFQLYTDYNGETYEPKEEINRKIANVELLRFIEQL